jgi:cytochrome c
MSELWTNVTYTTNKPIPERASGPYVDKCARCHGDAGQGTDKDLPVVGKDAFPQQAIVLHP